MLFIHLLVIRLNKRWLILNLPNAEGREKCGSQWFLVERGGSLVEFASQSG
jgi:hypothetical protein